MADVMALLGGALGGFGAVLVEALLLRFRKAEGRRDSGSGDLVLDYNRP